MGVAEKGVDEEVTSPEKVRKEVTSGDLSRRALFLEEEGGKTMENVREDHDKSKEQAAVDLGKGKEVLATEAVDVNSALQSMHVDRTASAPIKELEQVKDSGKERGTYKKLDRAATPKQQVKESKGVGMKRGNEKMAIDGISDVDVEDGSLVDGASKKQKKAGLADQSCMAK